MLVRSFLLAFLIACGGQYGAHRGGSPETPTATRGIAAAELPTSFLDARTGRQIDAAAFWTAIEGAQVVCVGEEHTNPHHHWFQLEVTRHLAKDHGVRPIALGMEMFQRPFQGVLDDYAARKIDDAALRSRAGYEDRWGYDYGFYGPTIDTARDAGATLLALNAAKELTKAVVHRGVEGLTPDERAQLPELVLDDARHRAWFDAMMSEMGDSHAHAHVAKDARTDGPAGTKTGDEPEAAPEMPSPDRIYAAQVVWDESMADGAAKWSLAHPTGTLIVLAGNGHCHDSAIVGRIKRRGVSRVISIQPVLDVEDRVASALASPMNDYLAVLAVPKPQVTEK
jgi:uncharacterized iron-regulated protein